MSVAVGATYDATIADTNNLHRRVIFICFFAIGAAALLGWLLAAFAVRPFKRLAQQARGIDAGDEAPDVEIRGATEAAEIADALNDMLQRIWKEQERTKSALASMSSSSGSPVDRRRRSPAPGWGWRWSLSRPNCTEAQRHWRRARSAARGSCCGCRGRSRGGSGRPF
jgi:hypothetical protein